MDLVTPISKNTGISSFALIPALEADAFQIFLPQAVRAIAALANRSDAQQNLNDLAETLATDQSVLVAMHPAASCNDACQKILAALPYAGDAGGTVDPAGAHIVDLGNAIRVFADCCFGAFDPQRYQLALITLALKIDLIRITASAGDERRPGSNEETFSPLSNRDEAFYCVHNALAATLIELSVQPVTAYEHAMRLIMEAAPEFVPDLTASQVAEDRSA